MRVKKIALYFLLFIICLLSSCVKTPITNKTTPTTFSEVFEQYWNMMNINYVYWEIDNTDWNNIYSTYKPLFASLDLQNTNDLRKGAAYIATMSTPLLDHHFSIEFLPSSISSIPFITNSQLQKYAKSYPIVSYWSANPVLYPYRNFWALDTTTYFKNNYFYGKDFFNFSGNSFESLLSIRNNILYFSFNQFALSSIYYSSDTRNPARLVIDSFLTILENLSTNKIKGIIIDIRDNGGGDVNDLNFLVGRFIDKPLQIGYTKYKNGNGRLQYTPWVASYINPLPRGAKAITIPIIALVNTFSASAAELTALGIKSLPNGNGKILGDTTFGATGPYTSDSTIWNAGPFTIGNFMTITTSSGLFKYLDDKIYESKGFPPDNRVPFDTNSFFRQGKDLQLEAAFKEIDPTISF